MVSAVSSCICVVPASLGESPAAPLNQLLPGHQRLPTERLAECGDRKRRFFYRSSFACGTANPSPKAVGPRLSRRYTLPEIAQYWKFSPEQQDVESNVDGLFTAGKARIQTQRIAVVRVVRFIMILT